MTETLAYKMQAAGHEEPAPRRNYENPPDKLKETFEKWLQKVPTEAELTQDDDLVSRVYQETSLSVKDLETTISEAHGLILSFANHAKITSAGLFVSALYNRTKDKEIVYDAPIEKPVSFIGYNLSGGRTLINRAHVGWNFGQNSEGPVINFGDVGVACAANAIGPALNYGKAHAFFGQSAEFPVINYGESAGDFGDMVKVAINLGEIGTTFGSESGELSINYGKVGDKMADGLHEDCVSVNCGESGTRFGENSSGVLIAIKRPEEEVGSMSGYYLREEECWPKLKNLFSNLKTQFEQGRNDYKKAITIAKKFNLASFRNRLQRILLGGGYDWRIEE